MEEDEDEGTVLQSLTRAHHQLAASGIPSPADEARLLMSEVLGVSIAWVMAHPEAPLPPDRRELFESYVARRSAHEPEAYIVGHKEFYGLEFAVNRSVLIPRPETELLVERTLVEAERLLAAKGGDLLAVDLGTGSGAVAVTLAVRQPRLRVIAVDSSPSALRVARMNATAHRVEARIDFHLGDLLTGIQGPLELVVANLPYIPTADVDTLMPDVSEYEPHEALDGGPDGTSLVARALEQATSRLRPPYALLFEIGDGQGTRLSALAASLFPDAKVAVSRDYAGFERILSVEMI